ncbi:hypothetical protein [Acinetobacter junii]|uniref:Transposase Helix-turn-helix domain-containing protein n=1 Tax=Acinetobacter junii TaxID=40215 RepID=A0AAW5RAS6_ACIJU|nr:hypothetical protein [Acinetobacter junii]MCU4397819.1 hypothetical protein [Acinetobacter junii]
MKYIDSKEPSETQFKRYTGISWSTFNLMVEQLKMYVPAKGRPIKLSIEVQILLCLSDWREYRTLFHVATILGSVRVDCFKNCLSCRGLPNQV